MTGTYSSYDALGLAELVRGGDASPAELLEQAIARAEAVNDKVGAIIRPLYDFGRTRAAENPSGPFG
ncbi:MAG: amidase, partial [Myxococcota bacterium]